MRAKSPTCDQQAAARHNDARSQQERVVKLRRAAQNAEQFLRTMAGEEKADDDSCQEKCDIRDAAALVGHNRSIIARCCAEVCFEGGLQAHACNCVVRRSLRRMSTRNVADPETSVAGPLTIRPERSKAL